MDFDFGLSLGVDAGFSLTPPGVLPDDIPGLTLWIDVSDISTLFQDAGKTVPVTADGDPIGVIVDKSTTGYTVSTTLAAEKPTYKTPILGGSGVARFSGDDILSGDPVNYATFFGATEATIFMVLKQSGAANVLYVFGHGSSGDEVEFSATTNDFFIFRHGTDNTVVAQPSGWDDTFHIVQAYRSGAVADIDVDDINLIHDTGFAGTASYTVNPMRIGANNTGTSKFVGDIQKLIIYNRSLTSEERSDIIIYLQGETGL